MSAPVDITRVVIEHELRDARAAAERYGWRLKLDLDALRLEVLLHHPATRVEMELVATLDGYRALPPVWRFVMPGTNNSPKSAWPRPANLDGKSSIFHSEPVICAPFNRLAYGEADRRGVHSEWGAPTSWLQIRDANVIRATTLAEMLAVIRAFLSVSEGSMQ